MSLASKKWVQFISVALVVLLFGIVPIFVSSYLHNEMHVARVPQSLVDDYYAWYFNGACV